MADYRKMYFQLCDAVERTLEVMESNPDAKQAVLLGKALLIDAQQDCEDIYVETEG